MTNEDTLNQAKILLVDDEQEITNLLRITLNKEGFHQVEEAFFVEQVFEKITKKEYDLIILDVILPDGNGLDLCKKIRECSQAPILFLTAKTSDLDKLTGFAMGADDYITKPFNPLEIVARIKVHLKRQFSMQKKIGKEYFSFQMDRFEVYEESGELFVKGERMDCPARELQLLIFLCQHPNHLFSRTQLYEHIWGEESFGDDNTVMVHIRRLREKIEKDPSNPEIIVTVRGLGYKLVK
ncbi:response regulator transcription factor [Anaeromicropila herbilytica]|uniref:Stage 0 sporulation protein A homolog n=1 Tax=Anaeromicropila herbilytica TaxID=2785025 RepID=A0A7R7EI04_9FIRM|nr:response regulator transcription factor [Anaeromicropila herbilytica]BCN29231.1 DNA-binding response regulator [Anaeromicropila herbilytica]